MDLFKHHTWLIIFFFAFFLIGLSAFSQSPILDKKISIHATEKPLGEILTEISEVANVHFSYSSQRIPVETKVTVTANNQTIKEILDTVLKNLDIRYFVIEEQIILKPGKRRKTSTSQIPLTKYTISGYIMDKSDGEGLIGATIYVPELNTGTITNPYGFYSITLPRGQYKIVYSYIGYNNFLKPVLLDTDRFFEIELETDTSVLEEVVVISSEYSKVVEKTQMSEIKINPQSIHYMPSLMGEVDVIKSLQSIPGITIFGDGSTLFFVRGGNKDQNLIQIDEAPIYNPSHLLGFFSTIIPDAVKEIKVYKGDMPASQGGRLSSLIDIKTKDGNLKQFGMSGSFGLVSGKITLEGPIKKDKSSFFISGRRSYFGWILKSDNSTDTDLYFYDLNAKINYRINDRNRLFLSFYGGEDNYTESPIPEQSSGINWNNVAGTLRWNHLFSNKVFSNTTLYASKYDYYLITSRERKEFWNSHIATISLKSDMTYYHKPDNILRFGIQFSGYNFNPGNFKFGNEPEGLRFPVVHRKNAKETILYLSNERSILPKLSIRAGFRLSSWKNIGESVEYKFDDSHRPVDTTFYKAGKSYHTYTNLEPRVGLNYRITESASLKASYASTVQYIQLITNSISPFTSLEVWLPSGPNIKPQKARQVSLGYYRKFRHQGVHLNIEAFFKHMDQQTDYEYHAKMLLNPLIEGELRFGFARSYGIELLVKKDGGRLNGWFGYSLSKTYKKINELYLGKSFPAFYDRPHDLSVYLSYKAKPRWRLASNWIFTSGAAITTPSGFYYYHGHSVPIYNKKNNDRLPDYHRLDISATFQLNKIKSNFKHDLTLSIYNVYGRENPISVNFTKTLGNNDKIFVPANYLAIPTYLPTKIFLYGTIPSITYKFTF